MEVSKKEVTSVSDKNVATNLVLMTFILNVFIRNISLHQTYYSNLKHYSWKTQIVGLTWKVARFKSWNEKNIATTFVLMTFILNAFIQSIPFQQTYYNNQKHYSWKTQIVGLTWKVARFKSWNEKSIATNLVLMTFILNAFIQKHAVL